MTELEAGIFGALKSMKLNKAALAALKESITHWRRLATGNQREDEGIGISNCALCREFIETNCDGCPVKKKTGKPWCWNTPYQAAQSACREHGYNYNSRQFKAAARKELKFLESLLP